MGQCPGVGGPESDAGVTGVDGNPAVLAWIAVEFRKVRFVLVANE